VSELIRSFIAFDLDNEAILKKMMNVQDLLVETGADLKPVETENIHITLRFLGDIRVENVERIHEEMRKVKFTPFQAKIHGVGAFPNVNSPRVVWAGITEGADELQNIFSQLEPRLRDLGFAPDSRGFSPHLTIARVRSGRNKEKLAQCIKENCDTEFGTVNAGCLRLKKSQLTPKGPLYSTLKEFCPQP
jgi:2'-5' RNA ligase